MECLPGHPPLIKNVNKMLSARTQQLNPIIENQTAREVGGDDDSLDIETEEGGFIRCTNFIELPRPYAAFALKFESNHHLFLKIINYNNNYANFTRVCFPLLLVSNCN